MSFQLNFAKNRIGRAEGAPGGSGVLERALGEGRRALADLFDAEAGEARVRAILSLPGRTDDLDGLDRVAASLRARFKRLYVLGTGGSSLGGQAITGALAPSGARDDRHLIFLDNVDPVSFAAAFEGADLREAGFLSISKSGSTTETVAQTLIVLDRLSRVVEPARMGEHFVFIVEPGDSPLRRLAVRLSALVVDHHPELGGRFSVLSSVGLLPALYLGIDARALRAGAAAMLRDARGSSATHPAAVAESAALTATLMQAGHAGAVLMIYGDALLPLGRWWQQLIAESLGKDGRGLTPLLARGATDQHSLLQLYLAGPADKFFTILGPVPGSGRAAIEPALATAIGIPYFGGRALDELFAAEADATVMALQEAGRFVRRIALTALDAATLGGLFMHFMVETVLIARLIGVDPFGQPAVERAKRLTREILEGRTP